MLLAKNKEEREGEMKLRETQGSQIKSIFKYHNNNQKNKVFYRPYQHCSASYKTEGNFDLLRKEMNLLDLENLF